MIKIDYNKCINCKLCIKDCFPANISFKNDKIIINEPCMMCGHCVAICPTNAIKFEDYEEVEELKNINYQIDPDTFLNFIKSRRSIRHFKETSLPKEVIEKLLEAGRYSPTGANLQDVTYFVIQDNLKEFKPLIWEGLKNFTLSENKSLLLKRYKDRFLKMYDSRLTDDKLFFKAPMLLVITSSTKINGILAADKIEMLANMLGLGVLFSGFIEMAINSNEILCQKFKLKKNTTCACMLIGYPDIDYKRTAPRKKANIEWL